MFRILSIDGGGVRGAYPASILAHFEQQTGQPTYRFFDLIAGTSTGGILALGLAMGVPATRLSELYETRAGRVFPRTSLGSARRWLLGSKYSADALETELQEIFAERTIGDARTRLCIPAVDCTTGSPRVFKTRHHERFHVDHKLSAVRVALATAAAPTYFPAVPVAGPDAMVDGGLWANNPSMVAIVEALSVLSIPATDLGLLSIGTGSHACIIPAAEAIRPNAGTWPPRVVDFVLAAQARAAEFQTQILAREMGFRYWRLNPQLQTPRDLDDTRALPELLAHASKDARTLFPELKAAFYSEPSPPFVPVPEQTAGGS